MTDQKKRKGRTVPPVITHASVNSIVDDIFDKERVSVRELFDEVAALKDLEKRDHQLGVITAHLCTLPNADMFELYKGLVNLTNPYTRHSLKTVTFTDITYSPDNLQPDISEFIELVTIGPLPMVTTQQQHLLAEHKIVMNFESRHNFFKTTENFFTHTRIEPVFAVGFFQTTVLRVSMVPAQINKLHAYLFKSGV